MSRIEKQHASGGSGIKIAPTIVARRQAPPEQLIKDVSFFRLEEEEPTAAPTTTKQQLAQPPSLPKQQQKNATPGKPDYEEITPWDINDVPIASFIKNNRKGKKMFKLPAADPLPLPPLRHSTSQQCTPVPCQTKQPLLQTAPSVTLLDGKIVVEADCLQQTTGSINASASFAVVSESGQRITSASFRAKRLDEADGGGRTRWSAAETALWYEALAVAGTDFGLMQELFGGKLSHRQLKAKWRAEERKNSWKVDAYLRRREPLSKQFLAKFKSTTQIAAYEQQESQ